MENLDKRIIVLTKEQLERIVIALKNDSNHHENLLKKISESHNDAKDMNMEDAFSSILSGYLQRIQDLRKLSMNILNGDLDV